MAANPGPSTKTSRKRTLEQDVSRELAEKASTSAEVPPESKEASTPPPPTGPPPKKPPTPQKPESTPTPIVSDFLLNVARHYFMPFPIYGYTPIDLPHDGFDRFATDFRVIAFRMLYPDGTFVPAQAASINDVVTYVKWLYHCHVNQVYEEYTGVQGRAIPAPPEAIVVPTCIHHAIRTIQPVQVMGDETVLIPRMVYQDDEDPPAQPAAVLTRRVQGLFQALEARGLMKLTPWSMVPAASPWWTFKVCISTDRNVVAEDSQSVIVLSYYRVGTPEDATFASIIQLGHDVAIPSVLRHSWASQVISGCIDLRFDYIHNS